MSLVHLLLSTGPLSYLFPRYRRASRRRARRDAKVVPIIASIPGSDVWFLRYALAFLLHLKQGGHITDRLRNKVVGNPSGPAFNFDHMRGGPLLWAPRALRSGHLFIGYTSCPGFGRIAAKFPWWQDTPYCAPGYDYFHEGMDYAQVPVDMAPHAYVSTSVKSMEEAAWANKAQRAVLVYPDPIEQAASYFIYARGDMRQAVNTLEGRRLADWTFRDYLMGHALPSYAKIFISYQAMAAEVPGSVTLVSQQQLLERPAETLTAILAQVTGSSRPWPMIDEAVELARKEHLAAVEVELGRSLDRARRRRKGPARAAAAPSLPDFRDPGLRREAFALLEKLGVDPLHFTPAIEDRGASPSPLDKARLGAQPAVQGQTA